jgi:membrane associated rhomboid family serine protease
VGLHERPYMQEDRSGWIMGSRVILPRPTRGSVVLTVLCGAMFVLTAATGGDRSPLLTWLPMTAGQWWQAWRYVSFQFLHDGPMHLFGNLMGLYFLGPPLERAWGTRRFVAFYLVCGAAGGAFFAALAGAWAVSGPLVGASGGVLGCLAACAILYPGILVFFLPIRLMTVLVTAVYLLSVMSAVSGGVGDALSAGAHLGGMAAAVAWLWGMPRLLGRARQTRVKLRRGTWQNRLREQDERQTEIDRILSKVHDQGIQSLSDRERQTLQDETRRQRKAGDVP